MSRFTRQHRRRRQVVRNVWCDCCGDAPATHLVRWCDVCGTQEVLPHALIDPRTGPPPFICDCGVLPP